MEKSWQSVPVDLLVFGPHPDDIEIGLGGTVARARQPTASGWACAIDRRGDGQQRHGRGATGGGEPSGSCSAPCGGTTCAGPIGGSAAILRTSRKRRRSSGVTGRARSRFPTGRTVIRIMSGERAAHRGRLQRRAEAPNAPSTEAWKPEWLCSYFINDSGRAVIRGRREREKSSIQTCGARLPRQSV